MFCINIHLYIHNIIHISLAGFQRNENTSQLKWTLMVRQMLQYVWMLSWSLREWRVLKVGEMLLTCGIPVSVDSMKEPEQNVNSFRRWLVSTGQAKTIQDHHAAWPTPAAPVHHQHQSSKHGTSPQMQGFVGGEGDIKDTTPRMEPRTNGQECSHDLVQLLQQNQSVISPTWKNNAIKKNTLCCEVFRLTSIWL